MKQMALKYFSHPDLTLAAFLLFFVSFMLMILKIYFYDSNKKYNQLSQIPFDDKEGDDVL